MPGVSVSNRMMEPTTNATRPPSPSEPKAGTMNSAMIMPTPSTDERQARIVHRQNLQGEQREHQGYDPDHAGKHDAGIVALQQQAVEADEQEPVGDRRMRDDRQQRVRQSGSMRSIVRPTVASLTGRFADLHFAAVDLRQQVRHVARDDVDHVHLECVTRGQARSAAHRLLSPFDIAAAQLRKTAQIRGCIVHHFAFHRRRKFGSGRMRILSRRPRGRCGRVAAGVGAVSASVPPIDTGVAAPTLVAGAIAAMWLA